MDFESRRNITRKINEFLHSEKKVLVIYGKLGMGKSWLINQALGVNRNERWHDSGISYFDFIKTHEDWRSGAFCRHIESIYLQTRRLYFIENFLRKNMLKGNSFSVGWGMPGFRTSYRFKLFDFDEDDHLDDRIKDFLSNATRSIKCFYLDNVELCQDTRDKQLLETLLDVALECDCPKFILEMNEEAELDLSFIRKRAKDNTRYEFIKLSCLSPDETELLYASCHTQKAPENLYQTTSGIPLFIISSPSTKTHAEVLKSRLCKISHNSEIVVYCLAAACDEVSSHLLQEITCLNESYNESLLELYKKHIISLEGENISFSHPLIYRMLSESPYTGFVNFFGRRLIVEYLQKQRKKSHKDKLELLSQYSLMGCAKKAEKEALLYIYECYKAQEFSHVFDCEMYLRDVTSISLKNKIAMLMFQTAVRMGNANKAKQYASHLDSVNGYEVEIKMMKAQLKYLENKFDDSNIILKSIQSKLSPKQLSMVLGIKTSNYIAKGERQLSSSSYSESLKLCNDYKLDEVKLELYRLAPEIELDLYMKNVYKYVCKAAEKGNEHYVTAKALHNFAVHNYFQFGNSNDLHHLIESAEYFQSEGYPEFSYSGICISAYYLLNKQLENAEQYLDISVPYLHEQYDEFCWCINKSVLMFFKGEYKKAADYLKESHHILNHGRYPLKDPYFSFLYEYNSICVAVALSSSHLEIKKAVREIHLPSNCFQYDNKKERINKILTQCECGSFSLNDLIKISADCNVPVMEVATLEFFDFNVDVLPLEFISVS